MPRSPSVRLNDNGSTRRLPYSLGSNGGRISPSPVRIFGCEDSLDTGIEVSLNLMLPHTYHAPSGTAEAAEVPAVSGDVPGDLLPPERREVCAPLGKSVSVPEAPVDEDSNFVLHERDIGCSGQTCHVPTKSDTAAVQCHHQYAFRRRVSPFYARHTKAALTWREVIYHRVMPGSRGRVLARGRPRL